MKLIVITFFIVCLWATSAAANIEGVNGGGGEKGNTITVVVTTTDPGKSGDKGGNVGGGGDGSTSIVSQVSYRVIPPGEHQGGDLSEICWIDTTTKPPRFGVIFRILTLDFVGNVIDNAQYCQEQRPGVPVTPPVLPTPPTVSEVWKSANIPAPDVITDPAKRGITGLETRITTQGPTVVQISASIRGFTIVGTATLDHYTISVDGGRPEVADHDSYTFETKGEHKIAVGAVWTGTATLYSDTFDKPIFLGDIGTATITSTLTYPLNEIRSVLQP